MDTFYSAANERYDISVYNDNNDDFNSNNAINYDNIKGNYDDDNNNDNGNK